MKYIKRFGLIFFAVMILVVSIPAQAFAVDPVSFTEATSLGATVIDLYGAVNNTSLAYDQIASSGALTEIVTLYQDYSSSSGDPVTLAAIGAAAAAAGAVAVVYDAITGQGYIQLYQEQYVSSLDGYWDYQLADLGFIRDSINGLFKWSVDTNDNPIVIPVYNNNPFTTSVPTIINGDANEATFDLSQPILNNSVPQALRAYSSPTNYEPTYIISVGNTTGTVILYAIKSTSNSGYVYVIRKNANHTYSTSTNIDLNATYSNGGLNYRYGQGSYYSVTDTFVPNYNSLDDAMSALSQFVNGTLTYEQINIEPSTYIGDPLQNPIEITFPDTTNPDYVPQPKRITTDIPWDPNWGNPLPDGVSIPEYGVPYPVTDPTILNEAAPGIWEYIVTHVVEVVNPDINPNPDPNPDPSDPTEVYTPFLPVALPSFNFSLSGIWHYVREWVASLGAWFTLVFEVWSHLPYAIVIPVFATAVIVVVLGVYKRFFM